MPTTLAVRRSSHPGSVVVAVTGALLVAALALAGPAAAMEDPAAPTATITHGPSCGPGVVRVQVVNGTEPHRVALVFAGTGEQDVAVLAPGEQVELRSGDVDWGTTVDVSIAVASADGATVDQPLEFGTYTRPSREDCDAIGARYDPLTSQPSAPGGSDGPPARTATAIPAPVAEPVMVGDRMADASVTPGGTVTLRGAGFAPGEPVHVSVSGVDEPIATVAAAADGSVEAVVVIPQSTAPGSFAVQLVGEASATTSDLELRVVAAHAPAAAVRSVPALAAGSALLVTGAAWALLVPRRPRARGYGIAAWQH